MHVTLDQYLLTLRGVLPWELLLQQGHRHLMDLCPICHGEWDGTAQFAHPAAFREPALAGSQGGAPGLPSDPRHVSVAEIAQEQQRLSRMRSIARRAREDLARLRNSPLDEWPGVVRGGKTRFRSRAFIHLLLEEAKATVRSAPSEAAALASLVPIAIDQVEGRESAEWARDYRLRAEAHHANALRVAGDLPAADRGFAALRRQLDDSAPSAPRTAAEIASLEASLRIGQRRYADADRLLESAAVFLGPDKPNARLLIKHASLLQTMGRAEQALQRFDQAAQLLSADDELHLHLATTAGRFNCLCDLDRHEEASQLLAAERLAFLDASDDHAAALYIAFQARVDLAMGRLREAEEGFNEARDRLLALDRSYDAVLVSLDLAETLFTAGRTSELRSLAADLVPLFRSRGVARETLASLRLLAQAVAAETVTRALVAKVRRSLESSRGASRDLPAVAKSDKAPPA